MKTDSATARPVSLFKCFQKHVSVNYFSTIWDQIPNEPPIMVALKFGRSQTHVTCLSFPVLIFWATTQISATCCYGDVLRLGHAQNVRSSRRLFGVFWGTFWTSGRLISPTGFTADGRLSGWCVRAFSVSLVCLSPFSFQLYLFDLLQFVLRSLI